MRCLEDRSEHRARYRLKRWGGPRIAWAAVLPDRIAIPGLLDFERRALLAGFNVEVERATFAHRRAELLAANAMAHARAFVQELARGH